MSRYWGRCALLTVLAGAVGAVMYENTIRAIRRAVKGAWAAPETHT